MLEHTNQPVISRRLFLVRMLKSISKVLFFIGISLIIGLLGYHYIAGFDWMDSLLNTAMIAGGMGEVDPLTSWQGKLFASIYAIYSGLFLIAVTGYLMAPIFHRVLHKMHHAAPGEQPASKKSPK